MTVSQYPEVIEVFRGSDSQTQDDEVEVLELLEATLIDRDEYEAIYEQAEYSSEMINRKRSRHSYCYYTPTSNY